MQGRFPVRIEAQCRKFKFWLTLTKNENKLSQIAYDDINGNENKAFWSKKTKNKSLLAQIGLGEFWMKAHYADIGIDYLQSAFSLKIGLVLISSSAIANHDVIITKGNETRREKTVSIFSSRTYALVSRGSRLCRSRA